MSPGRTLDLMAVATGLEPATFCVTVSCSLYPELAGATVKAGENQQLVISDDKLLTPFSSSFSRRFAAICHN
jgi:hypothetical protein